MTLFLVRHGRPLVDPERPASEWDLDPAGFDATWALRESGRLPARAAWFCSPEPKAQQTAQLLTDGDVGIVDELREHERAAGWLDDFPDRVRAAFAEPGSPPHPAGSRWRPPASGCCPPYAASSTCTARTTSCWSATAPRGPCSWRG